MKCKKLAPTCLYHLNTLTAKTDSDHPDVPVLEKRQVSRGKWNWWCSSEDHVTDPIRDSAVSEGGHFPVASGTDDAGAAIWVNCLVLHRRMLSSKQCNFKSIDTIFLKIICSQLVIMILWHQDHQYNRQSPDIHDQNDLRDSSLWNQAFSHI